MSESDGINEIFDDLLRQALMFAARLGEQAARARQQHIEQARAQSEQEGREAIARFDAERNAARVALAPLAEDRWWDTATPEQIGAAYQSATAWAKEDADIAKIHTVMDEQLAKRGVIVAGPGPGQLTALLQAKQWAAEEDPLLDSLHTREMINTTNSRDRERLNNQLVASWLSSPEAPTLPAAKPDFSRADDLRSAAYFKEAAATGSRLDGDTAAARAEDLRDIIPLEMESGPTTDDAAWYAQEAAKADALAVENWDTADRRQDFARTLHGKADEATVDARILADVSQGTHPTAAVKGPAPSATKARKNSNIPRAHQISKGGR
ncbi:hypothetical protein ASG92_20565 [Arthrobacter sp. Soil736]|uniref:hypothetical protein n=1 Tax=Arthrobacter sp. Soil736 TaxID=1736395 RepID=UPI0006F57511|nr:hypothetical protein [Arthrobacter sp. Soil736]KRE61781.1 hypothetical protein ASG92_20565 [Arthrobacter sp. Soil736]